MHSSKGEWKKQWFVPISGFQRALSFYIVCNESGALPEKAFVLTIQFKDITGRIIKSTPKGFAISTSSLIKDLPFQYIDNNWKKTETLYEVKPIEPPASASSVILKLMRWKLNSDKQYKVDLLHKVNLPSYDGVIFKKIKNTSIDEEISDGY